MPTTKKNLDTAFSGEGQTYQKYSAFAKKAKKMFGYALEAVKKP